MRIKCRVLGRFPMQKPGKLDDKRYGFALQLPQGLLGLLLDACSNQVAQRVFLDQLFLIH